MSSTVGTLPNLLVIGAQKAGSTWLHERLANHPDIFMSEPKELRFFGHRDKTDTDQGLADYRAHFAAGVNDSYRGESTPAYFWSHDPQSRFATDLKRSNLNIPPVVKRVLGEDIRLVVSLRNPVARAVSAFYHHAKMGTIAPEDTLREQGHRLGIIDMGFYQTHLEAWLNCFERSQIHVVLFDDIEAKPARVIQDLYHFLGLHANIEDVDLRARSNRGEGRALIESVSGDSHIALDNGTGPRIYDADIQFLAELYAPDIDYTETLMGRPLPGWKSTCLQDYV